MKWFYRLAFVPLLILASPYYIWRMLRRGGYSDGFSQRFGFFPTLPPKTLNRRRIWIQAVSVGEIEAIGPLLRGLKESGQSEVILTTTTSTGYRIARDRYSDLCLSIGIFPIDFWTCSRLAWSRIAPDLIILAEGELWPEHLYQAKRHNVPAYLINARLSDKSFARHQKFNWLTKKLVKRFAWIGVGSEEDARRFRIIGATDGQLEVTGNIKFDVGADGPLPAAEKIKLREQLGFGSSPNTIVLLGSSTWEGEETMLIEALQSLRTVGVDARLLLAPRHAERRDRVMKEILASRLPFHQRSINGTVAPNGTIIHLSDTTGELRQLTRAADLAFTGKSLPPHDGGQTPVECAAAGVPLVYGPAMTNFREICNGLEAVGAATKVTDADEAQRVIIKLAQDAQTCAVQHDAAIAWHTRNRGATARTLQRLLG